MAGSTKLSFFVFVFCFLYLCSCTTHLKNLYLWSVFVHFFDPLFTIVIFHRLSVSNFVCVCFHVCGVAVATRVISSSTQTARTDCIGALWFLRHFYHLFDFPPFLPPWEWNNHIAVYFPLTFHPYCEVSINGLRLVSEMLNGTEKIVHRVWIKCSCSLRQDIWYCMQIWCIT